MKIKNFALTQKEREELIALIAGATSAMYVNAAQAQALLAFEEVRVSKMGRVYTTEGIYAIVAHTLQIKVGTLKSRLHRGRVAILHKRDKEEVR